MTSVPIDAARARSGRTRTPIAPHTEVWAGGRVVAQARTQLLPDAAGNTLHIHIECAAGHQPPWARRLLVHDLLNRAENAHLQRVLIVIPRGDSEILDVLRERCASICSRSAGASCIVEATLASLPRPDRAG